MQVVVRAMNIRKAGSKSMLFVLLLISPSTAACAKTLPMDRPDLRISVYNDAGIPYGTLKDAENVSSQIFKESGIHIVWLNCFVREKPSNFGAMCEQAVSKGLLHVRVGRHSLNLRDSVLGISYLSDDGEGSQADIFYEAIEQLYPNTAVQPAIILGHVMAHEIGHLLLGTNSHSPWGIMCAHWHKQELDRASLGMMTFNESQSHRMTKKVGRAMAQMKCPTESTKFAAAN
jgi:hypothetical protein